MKFTKLLALGSVVFMVCGISLASNEGSSTTATTTAPTTSTSTATNSSDVSPN